MGESLYNPMLPEIALRIPKAQGLAVEDEGAQVVYSSKN